MSKCPDYNNPIVKKIQGILGDEGVFELWDRVNTPEFEQWYGKKVNSFDDIRMNDEFDIINKVGETYNIGQIIKKFNKDAYEGAKYQTFLNTALNSVVYKLDDSTGVYYYLDENGNKVEIANRVHNLLDAANKSKFRSTAKKIDMFKASKGTIAHKHFEHIIQDILAGNKSTAKINNEKVYNDLKNREEFEGKPIGYFSLNDVQYNQMRSFFEKLISDAKKRDNKVIIKTEQIIYDKTRDLAGTIDLMFLWSNGAVSIYDFKTIGFNTDIENLKKITRNTKDLWSLQLSIYAKMLMNSYELPANKLEEVRVLPFEVNLDPKNDNVGFKTIFAEGTHLKPVPSIIENTSVAEINNRLDALRKRRESVADKIKSAPRDERLRKRYETISKIIEEIQTTQEINFLLADANDIIVKVYRDIKITDKGDSNYIDADKVAEYYDFLKMYEPVVTEFRGQLSRLAQTDKKKYAIVDEAIDSINKNRNTIMELLYSRMINLLHSEFDVDLNEPILPKGMMKSFSLPSTLQGAPFVIASKIQTEVQWASWDILKELQNEVEEMQGELSKWMKSNNKSYQDVLNIIIDKTKGSFIHKYSPGAFKALREKQAEKDDVWIIANAIFDEKAYEAYRDERFAQLAKEYKDDQETLAEKQTAFINRLDARVSKKAWYNEQNYFLRPNDNASNYSEGWNFMNRKGNEQLLNYYLKSLEIIRRMYKLTDKEYDPYSIPEMARDLSTEVGGKGITGFMTFDYRRALDQLLLVRPNDSSFGVTGVNGEQLNHIPVLYTDEITIPATKQEHEQIEAEVSKKFIKNTKDYKDELSRKLYELERKKGLKIKSFEIPHIIMNFAKSAILYNLKKKYEVHLALLRILMSEGKLRELTLDRYGNIIKDEMDNVLDSKVKGETLSLFDTLVRQHFYDQKIQSTDSLLGNFTQKGPKLSNLGVSKQTAMSANKLVKLGINFTIFKALAGNINSIFQNMFGMWASIRIAATEDLDFNTKGLNKANSLWIKDKAKYRAIVEMLAVSPKFKRQFKNAMAVYNKNLVTGDAMFYPQEMTLDNSANTLSMAIMDHMALFNGEIHDISKFENPTGQPTIFESIQYRKKNDGKWEAEIPGISSKSLNALRAKIEKLIAYHTGETTENDKAAATTSMLLKSLLVFRNWAMAMSEVRFDKLHYDEKLMRHEIGRWKVFTAELVGAFKEERGGMMEIAREFLFMGKKQMNRERAKYYMDKYNSINPAHPISNLDDFIKFRRAKMTSVMMETRAITLLVLLMMLLAADWDDDGKADLKQYFLGRKLNDFIFRGYTELSTFTSPASVNNMLKSPIPMTSTVIDLLSIPTNALDEIRDFALGEDRKGVWPFSSKDTNDQTPMFYYTIKNTPVVNSLSHYFELFKNTWDKIEKSSQ